MLLPQSRSFRQLIRLNMQYDSVLKDTALDDAIAACESRSKDVR